jgi:hypothetical protein
MISIGVPDHSRERDVRSQDILEELDGPVLRQELDGAEAVRADGEGEEEQGDGPVRRNAIFFITYQTGKKHTK